MPIRTTPVLVGGIIEVDPTIDLTPFITAASSLVDEIAPNTAFTDPNRLTLIETWLSAHFYCAIDPRSTMERVGGQTGGGVEQEYQTKLGLNFATSHYGQMAMVLDTTGQLRRMQMGKRKLTVFWAGSACEAGIVPPCEEEFESDDDDQEWENGPDIVTT